MNVETHQKTTLKRYHGRRFTAKIEDIEVEGRISIKQRDTARDPDSVFDDNGHAIYLCQNKIEGNPCEERFGYAYSWVVTPNAIREGEDSFNSVYDLVVDKSKVVYEEI